MTAPQAAGVIHSDFERGFIRAETVRPFLTPSFFLHVIFYICLLLSTTVVFPFAYWPTYHILHKPNIYHLLDESLWRGCSQVLCIKYLLTSVVLIIKLLERKMKWYTFQSMRKCSSVRKLPLTKIFETCFFWFTNWRESYTFITYIHFPLHKGIWVVVQHLWPSLSV